MTWDSMVTVGRIIRPHGHRGGVLVWPETDFAAERFQPGSELQWMRHGAPATVRIATSREFKGKWVVTIEGVVTMNDAETLRGLELRVPVPALRPLDAGTHYVHDLEGCRVVTATGEEIGRVGRVELATGTPVLTVRADTGEEVLVPLAAEICRTIDVAGKEIVIDPPAGLIELNRLKRAAGR